jgi:hypothetical protein
MQCNGRMKLVQDVFLDAMKEKRRKLHRLLKTEGKSPIFILAYYYRKFLDRKQLFYRAITQSFLEPPVPGEHLIQLFMKNKNEIAVSHSILNYSYYWHKPLPFVGGVAPTPTTKLPPSFAYKKIEEVLVHRYVL